MVLFSTILNLLETTNMNPSITLTPSAPPDEQVEAKKYEEFMQTGSLFSSYKKSLGVVEYSAQTSPIGPTSTEIPFSILARYLSVPFQVKLLSGENSSKYFKQRLPFPHSFKTTPHVLVFLCGFEVASTFVHFPRFLIFFQVNDDHRINVNVENIDEKGFTLVVSSWGKTIIKQVSPIFLDLIRAFF